MATEILIGLSGLNVLLGIYSIFRVVRFQRLLAKASKGAANHFETLRKIRQVGV
jgi:hypothetical protein